jgi:hypothetical protein
LAVNGWHFTSQIIVEIKDTLLDDIVLDRCWLGRAATASLCPWIVVTQQHPHRGGALAPASAPAPDRPSSATDSKLPQIPPVVEQHQLQVCSGTQTKGHQVRYFLPCAMHLELPAMDTSLVPDVQHIVAVDDYEPA